MYASSDECLTVDFRDEIQVPGLGGKPTRNGAFQLDRDHQNAGGRQEARTALLLRTEMTILRAGKLSPLFHEVTVT